MPKVSDNVAGKEALQESAPKEDKFPGIKMMLYGNFNADEAKRRLGWEEVKEAPHLTDIYGNRVRLKHSTKNRPFTPMLARTYMSEILHNRWRLNGETIVITAAKEVASGQHRLAALVLAQQEWEKAPEKWLEYWPEGTQRLEIPVLLVSGIDGSDEVINTIDTGKPRTLEDVIYRSELFTSVAESEKKHIAKICSGAVKMFAERTRAWDSAFDVGGKTTHLEYLDLIERHPALLDCIRHVWECDDNDKVQQAFLIQPGALAGLMYLMATSASTTAKEYHESETPKEALLDLSALEKAQAFISEGSAGKFPVIREAHRKMIDRDGVDMGMPGRVAVVIKTWLTYSAGKKRFTVDDVLPRMTQDNGAPLEYDEEGMLAMLTPPDGEGEPEEQVRVLAENPTCGGIDLGGEPPEDDRESFTAGADEPVRDVEQPKAPKRRASKKERFEKKEEAKVGALCYVDDPDGNWHGRIIDTYKADGVQWATVEQVRGKQKWDVPYDWCSAAKA